MTQRHPHTDASYRVVRLDKASFGVEVSIPETCPTTVSNFDSKTAAEAWIVRHKEVVATTTSISRGPRSRMHPAQRRAVMPTPQPAQGSAQMSAEE